MNINELALYVQRGDDNAREVLFGYTLLLCKQLAIRYTIPLHSDDLSMDMVADVLEHFDDWEPDLSGYVTWVVRRSASVAQKHLDAEYRHFQTGEDALDSEAVSDHYDELQTIGPHILTEWQDDLSHIYSTAQRLNRRHRMVFLWHYLDEVGYTEIGKRLNLSRNATRQLVFRARERFLQLV